jgi:putative DNA primase/helicase
MKNLGRSMNFGQGASSDIKSTHFYTIRAASRSAITSRTAPELAEDRRLLAAEICRALGGRQSGGGWIACCPVHDDRTPSLSIRDNKHGKLLVHCHAGCGQQDVIAGLRDRGLWREDFSRSILRGVNCAPVESEPDQDNSRRTRSALAIWQSAIPAEGTIVAAYLRSRGIDQPVPDALRFHSGLRHPSGGLWPAMVALVTNGADGMPLAIHRTYLAHESGEKAPIIPQKMMLGPCSGGAVRLALASDALMVGEGIESCLAAMQATGDVAWAALSTSGLRSLDLPATVRDVIVLADGDDPGEAAARHCARRWQREGRRVRIARPPKGMDFNDLLTRQPPKVHPQ